MTDFAPKPHVEALLFASPIVGIGTFRCQPAHPLFRDSGPSSTHCFAFPRRSVVIQHAGAPPFVADPRVVTFYNAGQRYSRRPVSPDGDCAEWFALDPVVADEVLAAVGAKPAGPGSSVFGFSHGPSDAEVYLAQRVLSQRLRRGDAPDPLEVEETVLGLLAAVAPKAARANHVRSGSIRRHRALVDAAKCVLAEAPERKLHLTELARRVSCSVYHLCRVFKQVEGTTIHACQIELRLRMALEPMAERGADLTRIALDCGFSSHSHFTAAFRKNFGRPPSRIFLE